VDRTVLLLREADVRAAIDMAACMDAVEDAFAAYSGGRAELPEVIHLDVPERGGEVHIKAGHLHGAPYYAGKFASGFPDPRAATSVNDGLVVVFDAGSGSPAAFLLDNGFVTDLRTGAAGGVAALRLAPPRVRTVAVLGTGAQARSQLDALAIARPGFGVVRVWGRNAEHAAACVDDLRSQPTLPRDAVYEVANDVRAAVEDADVVLTCTASREPLVRAAWLSPGAHVTAVGSDGVGKQELHPDVAERADLLVVDSREQAARLGELQHAIAAGVVRDLDREVVELGEIVAGQVRGRTNDAQLTVCDLTGLGAQDVAAAIVVMRRAAADGLGERVAI
jgi:ornithine cyclodeaminase/alanine dehydrogenase-like protein (mu-crystallin family)